MVRRVIGRTVAAVAAVVAGAAVALAGAGPAAAKGPTDVAIGVPGGVPVELSAREGGEARLVHALAEDLGVWEVTGDGRALGTEAPTAHLGPALTVEWTMYNAVPANPDYAPRVVQTLYPYASGGALVHTEGGQRYFASSVTVGGWFRAPERLAADLAALGITPEVVVPAPRADAAAAPATDPPSATPAGSGWWPRLGGAAAAVVLVAAVVAVALRRSNRDAAATVG